MLIPLGIIASKRICTELDSSYAGPNVGTRCESVQTASLGSARRRLSDSELSDGSHPGGTSALLFTSRSIRGLRVEVRNKVSRVGTDAHGRLYDGTCLLFRQCAWASASDALLRVSTQTKSTCLARCCHAARSCCYCAALPRTVLCSLRSPLLPTLPHRRLYLIGRSVTSHNSKAPAC